MEIKKMSTVADSIRDLSVLLDFAKQESQKGIEFAVSIAIEELQRLSLIEAAATHLINCHNDGRTEWIALADTLGIKQTHNSKEMGLYEIARASALELQYKEVGIAEPVFELIHSA